MALVAPYVAQGKPELVLVLELVLEPETQGPMRRAGRVHYIIATIY